MFFKEYIFSGFPISLLAKKQTDKKVIKYWHGKNKDLTISLN